MVAAAQTQQAPSSVNMKSIIGRVATGPEYSKNISFEEAHAAMRSILAGEADPVQAGVYLIALRMKRETEEENGGSLQAILDSTTQIVADVDQVVDIAEPYDGYTRCTPVTPFLAPLLAACGLPAVSHGLEEVGPKFGVTHRKVLRAAGINVDLTPQEAAQRISSADIGWCYLDQQQSCKPLHDLVPLRQRIIKRPVITTVEVLTGPIRGRQSTHIMTGYVHKPYPPVYEQLAKLARFDSAVIVRGIEGGVQPALNKPGKYFQYLGLDGTLQEIDLSPDELQLQHNQRCVPVAPEAISISDDGKEETVDVERLAQLAAKEGLAALQGQTGLALDGLCYSAAIMLHHLNKADSVRQGMDIARDVIKSGAALRCFNTAL